jgi:hypothetical protein
MLVFNFYNIVISLCDLYVFSINCYLSRSNARAPYLVRKKELLVCTSTTACVHVLNVVYVPFNKHSLLFSLYQNTKEVHISIVAENRQDIVLSWSNNNFFSDKYISSIVFLVVIRLLNEKLGRKDLIKSTKNSCSTIIKGYSCITTP